MTKRQRLVAAAFIGAGIGLLVIAALAGGGDRTDITVAGNPAIEALIPEREADILRRDRVGIDLAEGYAAALTLESGGLSIDVPADQLETALQSLGQYTYKPADDKVLPFFPPQSNCVVATYWPVDDREDVRTIRWCFNVL